MSEVERLQEALRAAFANRALIYRHIFDGIKKRHGEAEAMDVMKEALYARGCEVGKIFEHLGPSDMVGLKDAFLDFIPFQGLLDPDVRRADDEGVDIKFQRCPLKEAWQDSGVSEDELAKLCEMAGVIDDGTFESAGFTFSAETWKPGEEGCCFLHIRPGPAKD